MSSSNPFRLTPSTAAIFLLAHACVHAQVPESAGAASSPAASAPDGGVAATASHAAASPAEASSAPKSSVSDLTTVVVTAKRANGFTSNVVGIGAFRDQLPVDVPLTNSVVTRAVLDSQGAITVMDAVRNTAGVTRSQLGASYYDNLAIRGVTMENRSSYRLDGSLPLVAIVPIPMEDKERVEVLKGASSMYYGMVPPAGVVNFEMKRAGQTPVTTVGASVNEWGGRDVALDVGRRFGTDERFGLRVNALDGKDSPGLRNYEGQRNLLSAAFDYRILDNLTLKIDAEHYTKKATEQASVQLIGSATVLPRAPDNRSDLAGKWAQTSGKGNNALARIEWELTDNWQFTGEYGISHITRSREFTQFAFNDISGYTTGVGRVFGNFNSGPYYNNNNARTDLSGRLETGPIAHELTFGWTRNTRIQDTRGTNVQNWGCSAISAACTVNGSKNVEQNLYDPIDVPVQTQQAPNGPQVTSIVDSGIYAVDRVLLSKQWQVMLGVRRTEYASEQTNPLVTASRYEVIDYSPNFSVIYKPVPNASIYASRLKGLEAGAIVGNTFSNYGTILPAAVTTQNEVGAKYQLDGGTLLQMAYFDIDRAQTTTAPAPDGSSAPPGNPNSAPSTWLIQTQDGEVQFKGLELAASGEINHNIGVVASAMLLNPRITRDSTLGGTNTQGHTPGNTSRQTFSLFGEYRFDAVPGLAVNAAAYFIGRRPVANTDNVYLPGVTTYSIGGHYRTQIAGKETTFQLNVDNATNKSYWSAADTTTANPLISYGLPRVIRLSAKVDL